MMPLCDCSWAVRGNMCKHQCKALMCKGHQGGSIIQQHGTWAGSQYEGLVHDKDLEFLENNPQLLVGYDEELQGEKNCEKLDVNQDDRTSILDLRFNDRNICVEKSREAWMQIEKMASNSDSIAQSTLAVMNRSLHDLKVQEQCQLETGKYIVTTADMFIRPNGLTLKRRLGIVDKYHGAKRGNSIVKNYLEKKRRLIQPRVSLVSVF